ncbi:MAG: c-type cytochrome, partial [Leeuwenhoekiella sp.]
MIQVNNRRLASRFRLLFFAFLLAFTTITSAQQDAEPETTENAQGAMESAAVGGGDAAAGKALFNSKCAACHKLYDRATGPALFQVSERHDREWLYKWIKNNRQLIDAGDPEALEIYNEYNQAAMNAFPELTNADIDNILAYTDTPKPEPVAPAAIGGAGQAGSGTGVSTDVILGALALIFLMLVGVLFLVNNTLKRFAEAQGVTLPVKERRKPIYKVFIENQFLVLVSVIFLLLGGAYFGYGFLMQVGVDQGYEPIQPIHYSHRIHAGENGIECKYCHSSARTSKHSGIPSLNVCMNCHKSIAEVAGPESEYSSVTEEYSKEFYDKEIKKLYAAAGWDSAT